ncbi:MAG: hypothetical protein ACKODX_16025 [Gemmata sp.]
MLTSFVLSMTLAAPVPAPAPPVAAGPAPRILELKATDGKVLVTVVRAEKVQVGAGNAINPNGGAAPAVIAREVMRTKQVELGEVKDLTVTTADGKKVETADALKKLAAGGTVVVSADGRPVSPAFLKLFKDDVLVLVSPELTAAVAPAPVGRPLPGGIRPLPVEIQPLPAPVPPGGVQILPAPPGVIQIQIAPAVLPAPAPAPEK